MQSFSLYNDLIQKVIPFFKKYGIFIAPAFLFLLFMFLLIFSYESSPQKSPTNTSSPSQKIVSGTPSTLQKTVSASPTNTSGEGMQQDEKKDMIIWSNITLSDSDFADLNATKTTLPSGSTQYTYTSDNPDRPNIIILKDGVNIFQRTPFTDTTMSDNTNFYGQPDYVAKGSQFWGPQVMTYIYLSRGIALVGDSSKDQLFEQIIFQPGTIDQFKQYDTDMIGKPQKP